MNFYIPSEQELARAEAWWQALPEHIKGQQSIWVILAMYAQHVLHTRSLHFDAEKVVGEI